MTSSFRFTTTRLGTAAALVSLAVAAAWSTDAMAIEPASSGPVLAELFTSQGCSSCPPADEVLGELSQTPGVLALAYHVDYWDNLGWRDTFSDRSYTARQQRYSAQRGFNVYTPQLVIEGSRDLVGSDGERALDTIARAATEMTHAAVNSKRTGSALQVSIGGMPASRATAVVMLIAFDRRDDVAIGRGENAGRRIAYYNVVRSTRSIGNWTGTPLDLQTNLETGEDTRALAIVVQDAHGKVWAAEALK